ncbi:MAG: type IV pilus modification protein PilV [Gammaproteobacteria bacterium]|nr:type IV pilus modification protein PilV [Gammaproteobacteria bacterium]
MNRLSGFTLIEVLVALVVLSIGLLGIAALQIDSVRTGYSALQRTHAVNLAADMADRIRANPNSNYEVDPDLATTPTNVCVDTFNNQAPGNCTPNQMAIYDVWEWRNALNPATATGLPDGVGNIEIDDTTDPNSVVITVQWTDKGAPRSYRLAVQQ